MSTKVETYICATCQKPTTDEAYVCPDCGAKLCGVCQNDYHIWRHPCFINQPPAGKKETK